MQSITAIDIVFLPDDASMEAVIAINRELQRISGKISHPLDAHACLPHVSLNMCGILTEHIPLVCSRLVHVSANMHRMTVKAISQSKPLPDGQYLTELRIDDDRLTPMHEIMLRLTEDVEVADVPVSAYVQSPDLAPETVQWTADFRRTAKANGFRPHITMNIGELGTAMECSCTLDRIALCQLGNYCACRTILFEHALPAYT